MENDTLHVVNGDHPAIPFPRCHIIQTVVFNTFVLAQIFNSVNSLQLDRILSNRHFMVIGELSLSPFELPSTPVL